MNEGRLKKLVSLIQEQSALFLHKEHLDVCGNTIITITRVELSSGAYRATIYFSFFPFEKQDIQKREDELNSNISKFLLFLKEYNIRFSSRRPHFVFKFDRGEYQRQQVESALTS